MTRMLIALPLLVPAVSAQAVDLVTNGDFEEPLSSGWTQVVPSNVTIDRDTIYEPDPDYEAHIALTTGTGEGALVQTVEIPGIDTGFSVRMTCDVMATSTSWAAAGVALVYLDPFGSRLGETRIVATTTYCPWENTPTLHLVAAAENYWLEYAFTIADELLNLPGIDPVSVRQVQVRIATTAYHC